MDDGNRYSLDILPVDQFFEEASEHKRNRGRHRRSGNRIRKKRERLDLKPMDLADILDISPSEFFRIESGERVLSWFRAEKLASILRCTPEWLLGRK